MPTEKEVELFIAEQERRLKEIDFEYDLLKSRYEALKVDVSYEVEQQAFNRLSPEEQDLVRQARQAELNVAAKPRISNQARVMRGRRGLRV